jgi:hypothetical protein
MNNSKKQKVGDYEFELKHRFQYNVISHMCSTGLCPHCGFKKTRTVYYNGTRCKNCNKIVPYLLHE